MERREREDKPAGENRHTADKRANRTILVRTIALMLAFGVVLFVPLFVQLYNIQIRDYKFYQEKAIGQQTRDNAVAANRGEISDCNGKVLAVSATVYDIIISPNDFKTVQENWDGRKEKGRTPDYPRPEADVVAVKLGAILETDPEKILKALNKNSKYEVVGVRVEQEVAEAVRQLIKDMHLSNSVYPVPTSKRYYTYGSLASQLIGWVNWKNDNKGAYGMEALYEDDLAGKTGRIVTARRSDGTEMRNFFQDYYDATDGNNLNLTIDTTIQYYCERVLEKGIEMFDVQDGGFVIAMDPKTGAIKGWANSPTYDLNDPWTVTDPVLLEYLETVGAELAEKGEVSEEEKKVAYNKALRDMQNRQWRNKAMNDTYEPGSTFKSMVLAAALEEGVVNEHSSFYCPGYYKVGEYDIECSSKGGHGQQDLAKAVANSCNPAFMMIGQALGPEKFYDYLEDFGFLEKTGIDMQGEGKSVVWDRKTFVAPGVKENAYLATASFGQRFQVTPIQLITAASAVVNGGHLMQPYVMKSITDAQGNVIAQTEPTEVRQVISEETSQRCRTILEGVVDGGTGKRAYVPGYRIGGKTGSSETVKEAGEDPIISRGKDYTIVSFLGFAPADDPQIVVLLAYNAPKPVSSGSNYTARNHYISGGAMAAVMAGELLSNILDHMGVEKLYTEEERTMIDVTVPNLVGQTADIGKDAAQSAGFAVRTVGEGDTVTAQIPVGGAIIPSGSKIVLYLGSEKPTDLVTVPDVRGQTAQGAQESLAMYGLYLKIGGSSRYMSSKAVVAGQSVAIGTEVERGTVVECIFVDNSLVD